MTESRPHRLSILRNCREQPEESAAMELDDFIITVFCWIDEAIPTAVDGHRLRQRGPAPTLTDSEVVTMEIVGEYLGLEQDSALLAYFRHHYAHVFPALRQVHRTTFVRQAANLWRLKERLCVVGCCAKCYCIPSASCSMLSSATHPCTLHSWLPSATCTATHLASSVARTLLRCS